MDMPQLFPYANHVSHIWLFIWLTYSMTVATLEWIVLCSLIAAIAAKVWQATALCGMHGGTAFRRNYPLLPHVWHTENLQIAPILSTEVKTVLFGGICYLEGYITETRKSGLKWNLQVLCCFEVCYSQVSVHQPQVLETLCGNSIMLNLDSKKF
jgi:hypothetical protein